MVCTSSLRLRQMRHMSAGQKIDPLEGCESSPYGRDCHVTGKCPFAPSPSRAGSGLSVPAAMRGNKTRARSANILLSFLYEQRKQSTLPLKAFSNREPLRAMLHDDENRLC